VNTYPPLKTSFGSDPVVTDGGVAIDRAEDGTARVRSYWTTPNAKFTLTHAGISSTDKAMLDAFYAANRLLAFTYVSPIDLVSRTCLFAATPTYKLAEGGILTATVKIEEV
jgi:hypothetical protein